MPLIPTLRPSFFPLVFLLSPPPSRTTIHSSSDHNTNILRRMVLEDGGVLKPPANALPCLHSLFVDAQRDEDALLSIWNECEAPGHGVVVSAAELRGAMRVAHNCLSGLFRTPFPSCRPLSFSLSFSRPDAVSGGGLW